jgi:hypothetical protein
MLSRVLALVMALASTGCWLTVDAKTLFGPATRHVLVEIVYGPDAEPITVRPDGTLLFERTRHNLERVFAGANKTVEIPTRLADMRLVPEITDDPISRDDAISLGIRLRSAVPDDETAVIVVVFLPGSFSDNPPLWGDTASYNGVTALAIGRMRSFFGVTGFEGDREQVLLIHELGHEVGLVDAGLPMTAPHLDDGDGGSHCTNPLCVMHTGAGQHSMSRPGFFGDDGTILFGDECLADISSAIVKAND